VDLLEEMQQRKSQGLFRQRKIIGSAQGPTIKIDNEEYLNFSSNDYLGFANNEELKSVMIEAVKQYGVGASSSQLLVGHLDPHKKLETKLSAFLKRDAALVFPTGYQANLAVASTLIDSNTIVLQDKLNHASLIDSALLSRGTLVRYRHNDINHLNFLLEKHKSKNLMVMTDGVFSMDGDHAKLREVVDLCNTYKACLVVDDAHGLGVLGETGAGLLESLDLNQQDVPLLVGTFGKAFGASGAFVSGSNLHIDAFIQKARTYIYTTALLPSIAATMCKAIDMVKEAELLRNNLNDLVGVFKTLIKDLDINSLESVSHIQPVVIGDAGRTVAISDMIYKNKILVSAIRPPTVPKNTSRLRVSLSASHTKEQIERLVNTIKIAMDENAKEP